MILMPSDLGAVSRYPVTPCRLWAMEENDFARENIAPECVISRNSFSEIRAIHQKSPFKFSLQIIKTQATIYI